MQYGDGRMGGLVQSETTAEVGGKFAQMRRVDRDYVGIPRERPGRSRLSLADGERGSTGRDPNESLEFGPEVLCRRVARYVSGGRGIRLLVECHRPSPTVRRAERTAWRSGPG